ncbi:MAG: polyphosphate kinase 1, partial [Christensenellaceae bacterium]|nr:polyphosphate kinase 1 [Christensenellaceae bacterium]
MAKTSSYINRELSWLRFNERVLEEAGDKTNPTFERIKFASIFMSNLDEFFMVRVGSLHDRSHAEKIKMDSKTGMSPSEQLDAIFTDVDRLIARKDKIYSKVFADLKKAGIELAFCQTMKNKDKQFVSALFARELLPMLSPQIIDKRHPFPFLNNLEHYVGVALDAGRGKIKFGLIPINPAFPRYIQLPGKGFRFCLVEDIIACHAAQVFKKYQVVDSCVFRVTRNADITIQEGMFDEDLSYKEAMRELLKTRKKLCAVRLEAYDHIHPDMAKYLLKKLDLSEKQLFVSKTPLELKFAFGLEGTLKRTMDAELFYQPRSAHKPLFLDPALPVIPQVEKKDVLLSYPFESMNHFIRLLSEAAEDPSVVSVKITLYRMASNSKVIDALIKAHEAGKEVFAVVELRARFDEQNNIDWASTLEEAGVTLSYGLDDYKTHSKLCLITRQGPEGVSYISQIGTGNYNEKTATQYTDLALITADPVIGADAADFFRRIALGDTTPKTDKLLIAPKVFRTKLLDMIDEQIALAKAGKDSSVIIKINSL